MRPRIAYSVAYKGTVLKAGGVGVKVKGSNDVPDSSTVFRIGSVSKVFAVSMKSKLSSPQSPCSLYVCHGTIIMHEYQYAS